MRYRTSLWKANKNLEIYVLFEELNESKQFWGIFVENYSMWAYDFYMTVTFNETSIQKILIFLAVGIQKLVLVGNFLWHFVIMLRIWLIHLLFL